jgi:hypothetical protein
MEVSGGLEEGDRIILNPGDSQHEGAKVSAVSARLKTPGK